MERILTSIIDRNLIAYETAGALEIVLINQKGFVPYYFLARSTLHSKIEKYHLKIETSVKEEPS